jgi:hypothetical protein
VRSLPLRQGVNSVHALNALCILRSIEVSCIRQIISSNCSIESQVSWLRNKSHVLLAPTLRYLFAYGDMSKQSKGDYTPHSITLWRANTREFNFLIGSLSVLFLECATML